MSRVLITTEHAECVIAPMLVDEQVHAWHLTEHSAKRFIGVGGDHAPWRWNPGKHERIKPVASYLVATRMIPNAHRWHRR